MDFSHVCFQYINAFFNSLTLSLQTGNGHAFKLQKNYFPLDNILKCDM